MTSKHVLRRTNMAAGRVDSLILKLFEIEAVKFGQFTLKSGIVSPVYVDLRMIVSHPQLLREVCDILWNVAVTSKAEFSSICGVPYTALPIASCISVKENVPMVMRRKEAKAYGTKKLIEGEFEKGTKCLIIEDVVTSGSSVMETVEALATVGLEVSDAIVLLDRFQGGSKRLHSQGINLHSALTLPKVIEVLVAANKINKEMEGNVKEFLDKNQFQAVPSLLKSDVNKAAKNLSYQDRESCATHPLTKKLFSIMHTKKSNLAISADLTTVKEVLSLVEEVGPYVCMVKTHVDILEDFTFDFVESLQKLSIKHNFLIFEDRKFADIGNTVKLQYGKGVYQIANWAHITNAHALPGDGVVSGLKEIGAQHRGCVLIGQMSAKGNLASQEYTKLTVEMAERHRDFVVGFICTSKLSDDPQFVHMTPGVKLEEGTDSLGQQYLTPEEVVTNRGTDVIIVGRGIYNASDRVDAAKAYQKAGYEAYLKRIGY